MQDVLIRVSGFFVDGTVTFADLTMWNDLCGGATLGQGNAMGAWAVAEFTASRRLSVSRGGTGNGTVTSSPPGIDCGSDCSQSYDDGTVVQLFANPAPGSSFDGWSGNPDCNDASLSMNADKSCNARFRAGEELIFMDGFESGDVSRWSQSDPSSPAP